MIERLALGLLGAAVIAGGAWRANTLTRSGAAAAVFVGGAATMPGYGWAALLITFFVISAALSRFGAARKAARTARVVAKHGGRDAAQVVANGSVFALGAVGYALTNDPLWATGALGALTGAFADTTATEIGTLFGGTPRSILTGRPIAAGLSGGITMTGSVAAVLAAAALSLLAGVLAVDPRIAAAAFAGGVVAVAVDSLLGALVQARRWCPACAEATERDVHACGTPTRVAGGLAWLDNDGVNAASTLTGGLVAATVLSTVGV